MISRYFYLFGVAQDRFSAVKRGSVQYSRFHFLPPHILVVTRLPMLLGTRKGTAPVTGFIDMMGYVGATVAGIATAIFTDMGGWDMAFMFWAVGAFGSAMALALLWNLKKKKETYT